MSGDSIYRVIFINQNEVYEIYAREVFSSDLYGFIEVEQLIFGERTQLLVDPSEEKLKTEFSGVTRTFLPLHHVLRIDEVEKEGVGKVTSIKGESNVTHFPVPPGGPRGGRDHS